MSMSACCAGVHGSPYATCSSSNCQTMITSAGPTLARRPPPPYAPRPPRLLEGQRIRRVRGRRGRGHTTGRSGGGRVLYRRRKRLEELAAREAAGESFWTDKFEE